MRFILDPLSPTGVSIAPAEVKIPRQSNGYVAKVQYLDELQDVVISGTPSDDQALAYDAATGKFIPQTIGGGSTYTDEMAQDAVGTILTDTPTLDFTYDDAGNTISATVLDSPKLGGNSSAYHLSRTNHTGSQTASTISDFSTAADARISAAAGVSIASLSGGKIPSSQIPSIGLVTVQTAANTTAMLALTTQEGDIVTITSAPKATYIRNSGTSGTLSDYTLLNTPDDVVTSVNGQQGVVSLAKGDVGLGNVDNTSDAAKNSATATLANKNISGASNTFSNIAQSSVTSLTTDLAARVQIGGDLGGIATSPVLKAIYRVFSFDDYGAVGDGSTDDTTAIQATATAAAAVGGTAFGSAKCYVVNGTVTFSSASRLIGSGMDNGPSFPATTFKRTRTTTTGSPMFQINGSIPVSGVSSSPDRRVTMSDFTVRGSTSSDPLFQAFYANRNHFTRIRFINGSGTAIHGVEFWDTLFDLCTFDSVGSSTNPAVLLQNRSSSTSGTLGYSTDNINRLSFRSCTWEAFTSKCIAMDATSNGSTSLLNNITIDDCKFETTTFTVPMISGTTSCASVYIDKCYFAADNGSAAQDIILWSGSGLSVSNCRFSQNVSGVVNSAIHLTNHGGQNTIEKIVCNWTGFAPSSGAAILIDTPASTSYDSVANVRVDTGLKMIDNTGNAAYRIVQRAYIGADQTPELIWEQTGTNPKKVTLGITASGNMSFLPNNGMLFTYKKPDTTNFFVQDHTNGRVAAGTVPAEVIAPNSSFQVAGSLSRHTVAKTANYTATIDDSRILVDATSGNITITLPTAVSITGRDYYVMKTDSSVNTVTVATTSSQTINGSSTYVLSSQYQDVTVFSDGANWDKKFFIPATSTYTDEMAQDAVGGALTDTSTVDFTYNDGANTISAAVLDSPTLQGQNGAYYQSRANHTGTQTASTVSDFSTAADARITAATGVSIQAYNASTTTLGNTTTGTGSIVRATSPALTTPTGIVKGDVGLGNVDNTSDVSKPISTATQTALDLKAVDTTVVHLSGTETVTGAKNFTGGVTFSNTSTASIIRIAKTDATTNNWDMGNISGSTAFITRPTTNALWTVQNVATTNVLSADLANARVGVNQSTPTSTFHVGGSVAEQYTITATNLTLSISHSVVEVTGAATITMPALTGITGRRYTVINATASAITVQANGTEVIGNSSSAANTYSLAAGAATTFYASSTTITSNLVWRIK